jgi:hypothetical protein
VASRVVEVVTRAVAATREVVVVATADSRVVVTRAVEATEVVLVSPTGSEQEIWLTLLLQTVARAATAASRVVVVDTRGVSRAVSRFSVFIQFHVRITSIFRSTLPSLSWSFFSSGRVSPSGRNGHCGSRRTARPGGGDIPSDHSSCSRGSLLSLLLLQNITLSRTWLTRIRPAGRLLRWWTVLGVCVTRV